MESRKTSSIGWPLGGTAAWLDMKLRHTKTVFLFLGFDKSITGVILVLNLSFWEWMDGVAIRLMETCCQPLKQRNNPSEA